MTETITAAPAAENQIEPSGMTRGMIVQWTWAEKTLDMATSMNVRPIGKVVTRDDLPFMGVSGQFGIQTLDSQFWVIDPIIMVEKDRAFYIVSKQK